jgi:hypothetical protein
MDLQHASPVSVLVLAPSAHEAARAPNRGSSKAAPASESVIPLWAVSPTDCPTITVASKAVSNLRIGFLQFMVSCLSIHADNLQRGFCSPLVMCAFRIIREQGPPGPGISRISFGVGCWVRKPTQQTGAETHRFKPVHGGARHA